MSSGRAELWIVLGSLALAAWLFTRSEALRRPETEHPRPRLAPAFAALPPGAQLLARVDLVRVRQSRLGAALTGGGRELTGLGSLQDLCGFDPTEQIQELALAVPERPADTGDPVLGIVATGDFEPERILGCAAKVMVRRGGVPQESRIGAFSSLRDRERAGAEVAVRSGGPVLVGEGAYFRAMLDAADGRGPTLLGDEAHATLRDAVGGAGAVTVTFIARPGWLERWAARDEALGTPLGAVRAGAVRVDLEPNPRATLLLSCPTPATCTELASWLAKTRDDLKAWLAEELGSDPLLESNISTLANAVRLEVAFDPVKLQKLLLALLLEETRAPGPAPSAVPMPALVRPDH